MKAVEPKRRGTGEVIVRAADMSRSPQRREEAFMGIVAIDPETGKWRTIYEGLSSGPISPDGRYMAYPNIGRNLAVSQTGVWIHDLTGQTQKWRIFARRGNPLWSHAGQKVVISTPLESQPRNFETWRVNRDGTELTRLTIPERLFVLDCSRDGNWLVAQSLGDDPKLRGRFTLLHPDRTGTRLLVDGAAENDIACRFSISPDGQSIAYAEHKTEGDVCKARLYIMNMYGPQRHENPARFEDDTLVSAQWAPDGRRLALELMNRRRRDTSLALVDADGSNYRTLPLPAGTWNLNVLGWRVLASGLKEPEPGSLEESPETMKPDSPQGLLRALLEEYNRAMKVFFEEREKAKNAEDRQRIAQEKYPEPRSYSHRFLKLAESAIDDPAAADALVWIIERCFAGPDFARAIDLLAAHHAANRMVGHSTMTLTHNLSPAPEKLFRAILDKSPSPDIKGLTCLSLGRYYRNMSEKVRSLKEDSNEARTWKTMMIEQGASEVDLDRLVGRDPDSLLKQAEEAAERGRREYGDTAGQSGRLAADAENEVFEIRELIIGKPIPEITGEDVDGHPMNLGDFRGKVVCLIFWTSSCTPCREIVTYQQSLATAFRDGRFVLLGVNLGDDRDVLKRQIKEAGITFRSWWDAHGDNATRRGVIDARFNIHAYPTIYVIDSRGVIRNKFVGSVSKQRLSSVISSLIKSEQESRASLPRQ
jgi:peroxiredoxin/Tol biopolymer transport system component